MLRTMRTTLIAVISLLVLSSVIQAEEILVIKSAFTSRASDTTLSDDPELLVGLSAGKYTVDAFLVVTSGSTGGFSVQVGGTAVRQQQALEYSANEYNISGVFVDDKPPSILVPYTMSGNSLYFVRISGSAIISTGGSFSIKWTQAFSSTTNTTVSSGSYLKLSKEEIPDP